MKNTTYFLAIATVFLSAALFVYAQDAASTPFRHKRPIATKAEEPPASSTIVLPSPISKHETGDTLRLEAIPTPTLEPIASPLPKLSEIVTSSPTPEPITTPTPPPKVSPSPTPKPTPSPKPTPGPTVASIQDRIAAPAEGPVDSDAESDVALHLKTLEERWEASFTTHDVSVTEELVAEDFVGTSSSGKVGNKETMLAEMRKDKNAYSSAASEEMTVHCFGPDVAVVTGIAREVGKTPSGKPLSQAHRFTDTWVQRDGKWECVAASAMSIPKKK